MTILNHFLATGMNKTTQHDRFMIFGLLRILLRFQGLGPLSFSHYKSFHLHSSLLGLLRVKTYHKYQICKKSPRTIKIPFRFACPKISMLPSRLVFTAQPHFNSFPPASPAHFHHNKWPLSSGGYPIDGFKRQIKQLIYVLPKLESI